MGTKRVFVSWLLLITESKHSLSKRISVCIIALPGETSSFHGLLAPYQELMVTLLMTFICHYKLRFAPYS